MRKWLMIAGALVVGGCAAGPDYAPPEVATPDLFDGAGGDLFTGESVEANLWKSFNDPLLDELITRAIDANRDIRAAAARLEETRQLRGLSVFSWFPTVTANAGTERNQFSGADPFAFGDPGINEIWSAGFDTTWEIDLFGSLRRQVEAIRAREASNVALLAGTRLSVIAEVTQSYYELLGTRQRLTVVRDNLRAQTESVEILKASLAAGRGTALDVARARALERSLAASLPSIVAAVQQSERRIATLTAEPVDSIRELIGEASALPGLPALIDLGTPQDWLRRRPDVLAQERLLAAATADVGVEAAEFYPKLNLIGSFGWTGRSPGDLFEPSSDRWRFGPSLDWRFLDVGRVRKMVGAAEARQAEALATFENTVLLALEEMQNSLSVYRASVESAVALEDALAASQEASELVQLRFDNGVSNYLEVLDAERTRLDLADQLTVAHTNRVTALVAVYKAMAGDFAVAEDDESAGKSASAVGDPAP